MTSSHDVTGKQLRWRCRRGMLELDMLLNRFLDAHRDVLSADQKEELERLLDYPDQLLLDLLLGNGRSSDDAINHLVERIRTVNDRINRTQ